MRDDTAHPSSPVTELLDHEEKYLLEHFTAECGIMPGDVEGSFHRIREAFNAHAPTTALRRIEQDLRTYAAGLPDGDDLRSVLELTANDAASALRNAPAQTQPRCVMTASARALELVDYIEQATTPTYMDDVLLGRDDRELIIAALRAPAQTQPSHQVPSITEAMVDAGIAAATANPTRTLDANVLAILAAALAVSPTVAQRVTDEHHMTLGEVVALMHHWQARALAAEAAPAQRQIRQTVEDAIREHFKSIGTSAVVSSDGIERVYYSGFSLIKLAEAIASAVTSTEREDT